MRCEKCNYDSEKGRQKFNYFLCEVCHHFSPDEKEKITDYVSEKIDASFLESFRKNYVSKGEKQKKGMIKKATNGSIMSRAPFGYELENGILQPAENSREVEEIFEEFLNSNLSLRNLSKKRGLSVNGLKKILRNFTYIGKVKFNNQIYEGGHPSLISTTLFNKVQDKLERMKIK